MTVVSMNTTQLQGLIGTLVVLGVLALVALPALIGVLHDRSVDRQLREAAKRQAAIDTLYKVLHDWFPGAAQIASGVQEWKGARPMLPDGPPVIGASGVPGLWLNLGHGSSGWALSCGSARALAD